MTKVTGRRCPLLSRSAPSRLLLYLRQKELDQPLERGGGILAVLRSGFKRTPAKLAMRAQPATHSIPPPSKALRGQHSAGDQVHHSAKHPNDAIDLVFFGRGIPCGTAELKTDNTQSINDAVHQYSTTVSRKASHF